MAHHGVREHQKAGKQRLEELGSEPSGEFRHTLRKDHGLSGLWAALGDRNFSSNGKSVG